MRWELVVGADLFSILFLLLVQVKYDTIEYWHKIYADNMEKFFAIFDSLTEGVSIGDINRLFSNYYLDSVFKPEWERFGVNLPHPNILDSKSELERSDANSTCCNIS